MEYIKKTEAEVPTNAFAHAAIVAHFLFSPLCITKKTKVVIEYDPKAQYTRMKFYEESPKEGI